MAVLEFAVADTATIAQRNLVKVFRVPELLFSVLITPLMFVPLFAYVFGSSIEIPGGSYREFLIAGTFALSLTFGAVFTGAGLAEDMKNGVIDRFRSLPMSRAAVVVGRTISDMLYNVLSLVVMSLAGLAVGWRIHSSVGEAALGFALLLLFAYAVSWVLAFVGLLVPSPEVVSNVASAVIFPLTFIANTFSPSENFPGPLRLVAEWNPVSSVTQAARELFGNIPAHTPEPDAWSLQHPVVYTLLWVGATICVFGPLAVRRYERAGQKR